MFVHRKQGLFLSENVDDIKHVVQCLENEMPEGLVSASRENPFDESLGDLCRNASLGLVDTCFNKRGKVEGGKPGNVQKTGLGNT